MGFSKGYPNPVSILSANITQSAQTNYPLPAGYLTGGGITWNNANVLDIGEGAARDATDSANVAIDDDAIDSQIDITNSGAWGLDAGAPAANTLYYIYIVDGTEPGAAIASLSAVAPTYPSGFTASRRIGAVRTNGAAEILQFYTTGNGTTRRFHYAQITDATILSAGAATTFASVSAAAYVPDGATRVGLSLYLTKTAALVTLISVAIIPDGGLETASSPALYYEQISPAATVHDVELAQEAILSAARSLKYQVGSDNALDIYIAWFDMEL